MAERGADVMGIRVLEVRESFFEGEGVGFPVTHVRLDVGLRFAGEDVLLGAGSRRFGEPCVY